MNVSVEANSHDEARQQGRVDVVVGLGDGALEERRDAGLNLHLLEQSLQLRNILPMDGQVVHLWVLYVVGAVRRRVGPARECTRCRVDNVLRLGSSEAVVEGHVEGERDIRIGNGRRLY